MTNWNRTAGDIGDTIVPKLGGIADLDAVLSVAAHVWHNDADDVTILDATVGDSALCTIVVELGVADGWLETAAADTWYIVYPVSFDDGSTRTWPDGPPDTITVRAIPAATP